MYRALGAAFYNLIQANLRHFYECFTLSKASFIIFTTFTFFLTQRFIAEVFVEEVFVNICIYLFWSLTRKLLAQTMKTKFRDTIVSRSDISTKF